MKAGQLTYLWNSIIGRAAFYTFQWHITEQCNLHCSHCYQDFTADEPAREALHHVLEQIRSFLSFQENVLKRPVFGRIVLTGGEPFLRDDFIPLLEKINKTGSKISFAVLTNGTCLDALTAGMLSGLKPAFVQVSLEGPRSLNDEIRGAGSFDQAVSGMRRLVKENIRTLISFTAHKRNYMYFQDVVETGCRIGVQKIWADRLVPLGNGKKLETLDCSETRSFFEQMMKARQWAGKSGSKTKISLNRALQFLIGGGTPYHCNAGDRLLTIMPDGSVLPCRRMPVILGNLHETPLVDIYYSSNLLKKMRKRDLIPEGCETCHHVRTCRGGARCLSFAEYRNPFVADPGCWLSNKSNSTQGELYEK